MPPNPFVLIIPGATRGLGLALTRQFLAKTDLPVYTSYRTEASEGEITKHILKDLSEVDPKRLNVLKLDLTSEDSIKAASNTLAETLSKKGGPNAYLQKAFMTGGILHPERSPDQMNVEHITKTFQVNVISHLLLMKHFMQFLPGQAHPDLAEPAKWAHVTARVGSISDNRLGGWWSYRSSKAALNQAVKTFDLYLQQHKLQAMCIGVHPGTMKTDLSKEFWASTDKAKLFEPSDAASKMINVIENLTSQERGKIWDWAGQEISW